MKFISKLFSFLAKDLAMDLGTANTLLATPEDGIVLNEPSVVALDAHEGNVLATGTEAKVFLGRIPERIQAIRPLKDGVIADFDVTRAMIDFFIRKVIKGMRLVKPRIVIGVPTGITQVEKRAVIESANQAGAREVLLIEEPMAAAIGANMPIEAPMGNLVVDIGGGTTEVAVISLSAVAYSESVRVAGDELDEAIQRYLQEEFKVLIGSNMAEQAKIELGSAVELPEKKVLTLSGKDVVSGRPRRFELNDFQVREAIKGPIETIVNAVHRAMEKTPPELVSDIANNGLLLAGGGALLSGLDTLISRDLQVTVHVDQDPLTTVVRGVGRTIKERERFGSAYIN